MTSPSGPLQSRFLTAFGALLGLLFLLPGPGRETRATTRLDDSRLRLDSLSVEQERQRSRLDELARQEEGGLLRLGRLEEQGAGRRRLRAQLETELRLLVAGEAWQVTELERSGRRLDSLGLLKGAAGAERLRVREEAAALARRLFPLRRLDALGLWLQSDSSVQAGRSLRRLPWLGRGLSKRLTQLAGLQLRLGELESAENGEVAAQRARLTRLERDRRRKTEAREEAARQLAHLQVEQREQGLLLKAVRQDRELAAAQAGRLRKAGEEVARQLADLQRRWSERELRRQSESHRQDAVAQRMASPGRPAAAPVAPLAQAPAPPPVEPGRSGPVPTEGLSGRRGRLPAPVAGRVARPFGEHRDPLLGTVLDNPGVDYACAPGATVKAVQAGRVEKATWVPGFGNTLLVSHGAGGWTVYAKLEEVAVREGQIVATGQALGQAGRFDNPDEGSLHFELWQDARPQDPRPWLKP